MYLFGFEFAFKKDIHSAVGYIFVQIIIGVGGDEAQLLGFDDESHFFFYFATSCFLSRFVGVDKTTWKVEFSFVGVHIADCK